MSAAPPAPARDTSADPAPADDRPVEEDDASILSPTGAVLTGHEEDWELIRKHHAEADPLDLAKIAVREYAALLRRRALSDMAGKIRFAFEPRRPGAFDAEGETAADPSNGASSKKAEVDEPAIAA